MALKEDGDRVKLLVTISKKTDAAIRQLADETHRPLGRMVDEIVERYIQSIKNGS